MVAAVLYRVVPNINFFWVVEAMTADIDVPFSYILYTTIYAVLVVTAILMLGVALFQRREVG